MRLVYSTNELELARRLAYLLECEGIKVHLSNENTAQLGGLAFARTPGFIGVWVMSSKQIDQAHAVMLANDFSLPPSTRERSTGAQIAPWKIICFAALFVAALGALAAIAP